MIEQESLFIRQPDHKQFAKAIAECIKEEACEDGVAQFMAGVGQCEDFLTEEGRHFLEGQIFAYGTDLRAVCRTMISTKCPDEVVVPNAEIQLPVIGEFASEFNAYIKKIFPLPLKKCLYQLRVYEPRYQGHPPHMDYAPGYVIRKTNGKSRLLTSLSFSLPVSWNDGVAPEFRLVNGDKLVKQTIPGSLIVFGPRVIHSHPAAPNLDRPYAWLIMQSFHEHVMSH